MKSIDDQPLGALADAIASQAPAPGAGVAATAALALGIACARKAAAITLKHDGGASETAAAEKRLAGLQDKSLRLAERDAACFPRAIKGDEQATRHLVRADRDLLATAEDASRLIDEAAPLLHSSMRNDILAARALIAAALGIVRANLAENAGQSSGSIRSVAER